MYAHSSNSIAMLITKAWGEEVGEVEEKVYENSVWHAGK